MKKLALLIMIALGMLAAIAWEGRASQRKLPAGKEYGPEMAPVYLVTFWYEWSQPTHCQYKDHNTRPADAGGEKCSATGARSVAQLLEEIRSAVPLLQTR